MTLQGGVRHTVGALLVSAFVLVGVASADARTHVYVRIGPPAPIVEVRPVAPGPGYVWVPGTYRWDRRAYIWAPGRWVRPPRGHGVWIQPRWVHGRHGWYEVPGRWRS
jgi:WXXGXW repeat (2 copies)